MTAAILVTGGAGYIGAHVAKALAHSGYVPVTLDNLVYGHREAVRWGPFVEGDIGDEALVTRTLTAFSVKAVVHLAGFCYVGESVQQPLKYFENNVSRAIALLKAMQKAGTNAIVFSSTCAVYGAPKRLPLTEDDMPAPINPYGRSKLMFEQILEDAGRAYGLSWMALRYFNAAGADPDGEIGEDHAPETHLIPLAILSALGQRPPLEILGTDYPTRDGTAIRDYVHVADLAEAHVQAVRRLLAGGPSGALNLGTGRGHSVREILEAVARVSGTAVPSVTAPRRPGDPPVLIADPSRAMRELDWAPSRGDIDAIVRTAWNWHRRHSAPRNESEREAPRPSAKR